jgi:hypothetical protein
VPTDGKQIGVAHVVSERARFAYLCDVFVLAPKRGRGVGRALLRLWDRASLGPNESCRRAEGRPAGAHRL